MYMDRDTREDILGALDFLKDVCRNNPDCKECPLGSDDGSCRIEFRPADWDVKASPDYEVWRAFDI